MALLSLSLCLVSVILSLVTSPVTVSCEQCGVKLENNEYTGIVVAIHEDEPENLELIDVIKEMFISGSDYLYTATKKRAFFKEVTILIPLSWPDRPSYTSPGIEKYEEADIIVAAYNPRYSPHGSGFAFPYTKQLAGCGEQSRYIHLTSSFLLKDFTHVVGDYGRVLVHEWGHYRWGLFNEYPDHLTDRGEGQVKYFYHSARSQIWKPVSCTSDWRFDALKFTGIPRAPYESCLGDQTNGYEEDCIAKLISVGQLPYITGSIMDSLLTFPQVVNFCDNNLHDRGSLHNSEAPNKQNEQCDGRSCWEVMRDHQDFNDPMNNQPRELDDRTPTFFVVKSKVMRIVLVLDTSGSMRASDRYLKLADAARTYIMTVAAPGTFIGIVDFDGYAKIISSLREMTSDTVRRTLANLVPENAAGSTCIGCGIEKALHILKENGDPGGSKILLMTDGEDGQPGRTTSVLDEVIENKVTIDVVAITNADETSNIERLATETCGKFYLQTDGRTDDTLWKVTRDNSGGGGRDFQTIVDIRSSVVHFEKDDTLFEGHVYIDETIGKKTTFDFTYFRSNPTGRAAVYIVLVSPSGRMFHRVSLSYDDDLEFKKVTIRIPDIAEPGQWTYYIHNQDTTVAHDVIVSVSSFPSQEGVDAIRVSSFLRGSLTGVLNNKPLVVYAEVRQGLNLVVRARVIATVETPSGVSVELQLYDNGADPDVKKNDGTYSRYFSHVYRTGIYGFKIRVENYGSAMKVPPLQHSDIGIYFSPELLAHGNISEFLGNIPIALPGAPIPEIVGVPAPVFTREVSGGARIVSELPPGWDPSIDTFAPSKITDLVVLNTSFSLGTVTINFTAPGDDFDFGNAHHYVMRWASSSKKLRDKSSFTYEIYQTNVLHGNLFSPAPYGAKERMIIRVATIPRHLNTYSVMLGLYAVDEAGNEGDMSNTVTVTFRKVIPTPEPVQTTTTETEDQSCHYRYHPFHGFFLDCDN